MRAFARDIPTPITHHIAREKLYSAMIWRPFSILFIVVYLTAADQSDEEGGVHETQSAQCTITAGDVQASAQATISKRLEGVCGSGTPSSFAAVVPRIVLC